METISLTAANAAICSSRSDVRTPTSCGVNPHTKQLHSPYGAHCADAQVWPAALLTEQLRILPHGRCR
jgi:hypothetical protein